VLLPLPVSPAITKAACFRTALTILCLQEAIGSCERVRGSPGMFSHDTFGAILADPVVRFVPSAEGLLWRPRGFYSYFTLLRADIWRFFADTAEVVFEGLLTFSPESPLSPSIPLFTYGEQIYCMKNVSINGKFDWHSKAI